LDEHLVSIFRVEDEAKQETSMKQAARKAWLTLLPYKPTFSQAICFGCCLFHTGFLPLKT
jgi:hypothetical protein